MLDLDIDNTRKHALPYDLQESFENDDHISNINVQLQNPKTMFNFVKFGFGKYSSIVVNIAFKHTTPNRQKELIGYLCNPNMSPKFNEAVFGILYLNFPFALMQCF